jgi:hypothetical protein
MRIMRKIISIIIMIILLIFCTTACLTVEKKTNSQSWKNLPVKEGEDDCCKNK